MTSANVIEYTILKNEKQVGSHRENVMCQSHYEELLKFEPLKEHTIVSYGYDEEEELWENEPENLEVFMTRIAKTNKVIEAYLNGNKNIFNTIKERLDEIKKTHPVGTEMKCVIKGFEGVINGTPYADGVYIRAYCTNGKRLVIAKIV
jgi:hypothetical protein